MVDGGADVNQTDSQGLATPLTISSSNGHLEIVKRLVLRGADMKREVDGLTALDWAAVKGHNKIVGFFIKSGARFD